MAAGWSHVHMKFPSFLDFDFHWFFNCAGEVGNSKNSWPRNIQIERFLPNQKDWKQPRPNDIRLWYYRAANSFPFYWVQCAVYLWFHYPISAYLENFLCWTKLNSGQFLQFSKLLFSLLYQYFYSSSCTPLCTTNFLNFCNFTTIDTASFHTFVVVP